MTKEELLKIELEKFQGDWRQIGYERDGIAEPDDEEKNWSPLTTFEGNSFMVTIADGTVPIRGTFKIDPAREPKAIDYTDTFGEYAGKTFLAIYYFDDDALVFCAGEHSGERPGEFRTTPGQVMRTLQRERNDEGSILF